MMGKTKIARSVGLFAVVAGLLLVNRGSQTAVFAQASTCVSRQTTSTDCKCGPKGTVFKASCTITVDPLTGKKCGGPYCESC